MSFPSIVRKSIRSAAERSQQRRESGRGLRSPLGRFAPVLDSPRAGGSRISSSDLASRSGQITFQTAGQEIPLRPWCRTSTAKVFEALRGRLPLPQLTQSWHRSRHFRRGVRGRTRLPPLLPRTAIRLFDIDSSRSPASSTFVHVAAFPHGVEHSVCRKARSRRNRV